MWIASRPREARRCTPQVAEGHDALVEFLLAAGANPNARDAGGCTALHLAAQADRVDLVQVLLDYRANVNPRDGRGLTPLDLAPTSDSATAALLTRCGGTSGR